ncbi:hypothetical protein SAMN04515678_101420 [Roseivivax sediminis]|uniref:Uncharacterized protein n=1 Tax=Roseivivax sediminis TaxID=936889 RepID=A0A1I1T4U0_9RHOB|nr:hypothetical protein SAMN04515678_101420 [Roseivivax sediminis]
MFRVISIAVLMAVYIGTSVVNAVSKGSESFASSG